MKLELAIRVDEHCSQNSNLGRDWILKSYDTKSQIYSYSQPVTTQIHVDSAKSTYQTGGNTVP